MIINNKIRLKTGGVISATCQCNLCGAKYLVNKKRDKDFCSPTCRDIVDVKHGKIIECEGCMNFFYSIDNESFCDDKCKDLNIKQYHIEEAVVGNL